MEFKKNISIPIVSVLVGFILSGCTAGITDRGLDFKDLNISRNSALVEHESMKAATAILIKKSRQYDSALVENKGFAIDINNGKNLVRTLQSTVDDLNSKLLLLSDDIVRLNGIVVSLQSAAHKPKIETNSTASLIAPIKESASISNDLVVPKVEVVKMPRNKEVSNKKDTKKESHSKKKKKQKAKTTSVKDKKNKEKNVVSECRTSDELAKLVLSDNSKVESASKHVDNKTNFVTDSGKALVNRNTFFYSSPISDQKYKSIRVKEGELIEYVGKNRNWYKINEGKYLKATSAIDVSLNSKK